MIAYYHTLFVTFLLWLVNDMSIALFFLIKNQIKIITKASGQID